MRKTIRRIMVNSNENQKELFESLICEVFNELEKHDEEAAKKLKFGLHTITYGEHLSEDMAMEWVSRMKNRDGSVGEHWKMQDTDSFKGQFNGADFYAILNMMYSDHYNPKFTTNDYVQMAKEWFEDEDVESGKTLRYYMYVVC